MKYLVMTTVVLAAIIVSRHPKEPTDPNTVREKKAEQKSQTNNK